MRQSIYDNIQRAAPPPGSGRKRRAKKNSGKGKKRSTRVLAVCVSVFVALSILYAVVVYSSIPFVSYWRTIWIETAMTTRTHQWLAQWFFPKSVIDKVMAGATIDKDIQGGADNLKNNEDNSPGTQTKPTRLENNDILKQKSLNVGDTDYAGNTVVINDIDEGLVVSEIVTATYRGKIMLIDDPSRVYVGMTQYPGVTGMRILNMMETYNAVAGMNGSGFADPYENGNGGEVVGMSCSQGNYWGSYVDYYGSIVLTTENKLVVGDIQDWESYSNVRDGVQFSPVLVADGQKMVSGSAGYGLQPRTAIGPREDGVIVFLDIDGRDVSWSIGCTVDDMAEILISYGVVNAASVDGGASSVIAYKGEVITKNCSANPTLGRILPNAFLVKHKADS